MNLSIEHPGADFTGRLLEVQWRRFPSSRGGETSPSVAYSHEFCRRLTSQAFAKFQSRYYYNFWRSVTAIRNADSDGNPLTEADLSWSPLSTTPLTRNIRQRTVARLYGIPLPNIRRTRDRDR
jgi:hypothetical protein